MVDSRVKVKKEKKTNKVNRQEKLANALKKNIKLRKEKKIKI